MDECPSRQSFAPQEANFDCERRPSNVAAKKDAALIGEGLNW